MRAVTVFYIVDSMRKIRYGWMVLLACVCTGVVQAQVDAQFSQYFMSMGYYNPGYAGVKEDLNIFATHSQQLLGLERAPQTTFVTADMPLTFGQTTHGVGVVFASDQLGLKQYTNFAGQYAYKKGLFGGTLSVGIQAGVMNQTFHGDEMILPGQDSENPDGGGQGGGDPDDPSLPPNTTVTGMSIDLNFGAYYTRKDFYAGFGVMHALEPEIRLDDYVVDYLARTFNLTAGYNIQTRNPLYQIQPSVFLKTDMSVVMADLTARVVYNKMFNGGVSWRISDSGFSTAVVVLLGVSFGRFQAGYAYDFPTNALLKASSGSHELMIKYSFKLKKTKTGKNRHKSVRIL